MLPFFILALVISGCSSSRSKYAAFKKKEGYRDMPAESGFQVVSFKANAYTKEKDAELFAKFRAIEICKESGKKLANIMQVQDLSEQRDVIRTSSSGFPSYYYGMSPFYGRYHSGLGLGFSTMSSNSWEETYTYPEFSVVFTCTDDAFGPELVFRQVSAEDMKLLVKDLKGALQVEDILDGSPNTKVIEVGDVITRANGSRIQSIPQLMKFFMGNKREVDVEIMREGTKRSALLKSVEVSNFLEKSQTEIIQSACKKKEIKERKVCKG